MLPGFTPRGLHKLTKVRSGKRPYRVETLLKLRKLGADHSFACMLDELQKLGEVTPEQAQDALERYQNLKENAPTPAQVGRYAAVGAVATPVAGALRDVIRGEQVFKGVKVDDVPIPHGRLRGAAAHVVGGALVSGGIPIVRHYLDQHAEEKKLRKFLSQPEGSDMSNEKQAVDKDVATAIGALAAIPVLTAGGLAIGIGPRGRAQINREIHDPRLYSNLRGAASFESAKERVQAHKDLDRDKNHSILSAMREGFTRGGHDKKAFTLSRYSGPLSMGRIPMASSQPDPGAASKGHGVVVGAIQKTATTLGEEALRGALTGGLVETGYGAADTLGLGTPARDIPVRAAIGALGGAAASTTGRALGALTDSQLLAALGGSTAGTITPALVNAALRQAKLHNLAVGSSAPVTGLLLGLGAEQRRNKQASGAGTSFARSPAQRLAATRAAGKLDYTHPGTSITELSKPKGPKSGGALPGTTKMGGVKSADSWTNYLAGLASPVTTGVQAARAGRRVYGDERLESPGVGVSTLAGSATVIPTLMAGNAGTLLGMLLGERLTKSEAIQDLMAAGGGVLGAAAMGELMGRKIIPDALFRGMQARKAREAQKHASLEDVIDLFSKLDPERTERKLAELEVKEPKTLRERVCALVQG